MLTFAFVQETSKLTIHGQDRALMNAVFDLIVIEDSYRFMCKRAPFLAELTISDDATTLTAHCREGRGVHVLISILSQEFVIDNEPNYFCGKILGVREKSKEVTSFIPFTRPVCSRTDLTIPNVTSQLQDLEL